ncbi:MAG TPA: 16S rRNA (guanine(527)-N(7))-methyltransferase RsmG [Terriglobales bacterium]|nr:16S rRNA (guanine(527)-N(7))-methyltransferase RsmG [Terriglobales bacterium]
MTESRITQLLEPFLGERTLLGEQLCAIQIYLDFLLKWNAKLNLTAIRDPEEIIKRHFGESIFAARQLFPEAEGKETAIDVGSGAGFPGLAIKNCRPDLKMTLVESNQRKSTFLREVVRALEMKEVEVISSRAESLSIRADLVTLRAVERFESVLATAAKLVQPKGRLALLIGESQLSKARSVLPQLDWAEPIPVPSSNSRILLVANR